jgi:hypothetical protein
MIALEKQRLGQHVSLHAQRSSQLLEGGLVVPDNV